jgi:hypothetical protein
LVSRPASTGVRGIIAKMEAFVLRKKETKKEIK